MSQLISILFILLFVSFSTLYLGPKFGLTVFLGVLVWAILEGLGFGFAGPWWRFILYREARGMLAQVISIMLFSTMAFPLLNMSHGYLTNAHAPISLFTVLGARQWGGVVFAHRNFPF